jgi:hypothetical protein
VSSVDLCYTYHVQNPKGVRGIDADLWRRFRSYAVSIGIPVGELLNEVLAAFLKDKRA